MELFRTVQPGGMRDATDVTSAAVVAVNLTAFIGRYVTLTWDQSVFFSMAPAATGFTLDSTANAVAAATAPTSGALVPERVFLDPATAVARSKDVYVEPANPYLLVRAQGTTATYTEVKVTSPKLVL